MNSDVPPPSSFDDYPGFHEESRWQKLQRRLKEEPLVPIGILLTCAALFGASRSMRAGDHNRTNIMFRRRIYAQGFTIAAMVVGSMYWETDRKKRKEFEGVLSDKKAKEKHEAWLRELEARDAEDKAFKAKMQAKARKEQERRLTEAAQDVSGTAAVKNAAAEQALKETTSVLEPCELRRDGKVLAALQELWLRKE